MTGRGLASFVPEEGCYMGERQKRVRGPILQIEFPKSDGPTMKDVLERLAEKNYRSASSEACLAIEEHLTAAGVWPPAPAGKRGGK
jgi:hypothetical protein